MTAAAQRRTKTTSDLDTPRLLAGIGDAPLTLAEHLAVHGEITAPVSDHRFLSEVEAAGIQGHGGAGFPLARKIASVRAGSGRAVVVANGMEGEPASRKDTVLMTRAPHLVLDGIQVASAQTGAEVAHLVVHRGSPAVAVLQAALRERRDRVPVTLHPGPDRYVSSEESALVRFVDGLDAKPAFVPPRPYEKGVGGRPTLVNNVETLAHLALVAHHGAAWFAGVGHPSEPGTRLLTVDGAVQEVATDVTVGQLVFTDELLVGGYFGSWERLGDVAQAPVTQTGLRAAGAALGASVLASLPAGTCGLAETSRIATYLADHSARQCGPCLNGLPAIAGALHRLAFGGWSESMAPDLNRWMALVPGRGACRHPDGAVRLVVSSLRTFATHVDDHRRHGPCPAAGAPALLPVPGRLRADAPWR